MSSKAFAIIAGVGPGTGASIARKFAQTYSVVLLARNPSNFDPIVNEINASGGHATGISTDLSSSQSVGAAFDKIKQQYEGSALAAAVFNPSGGFARKPFMELTEEEFAGGFENQGYVRCPKINGNHGLTLQQKRSFLLCPRLPSPPAQRTRKVPSPANPNFHRRNS